jgi:anti-sigma factor ChrR (cupin superfamily)
MRTPPALLVLSLLLCACPKQTGPDAMPSEDPPTADPTPASDPGPDPPATMAVHPADSVAWRPINPDHPDGIQVVIIAGDPEVGPVRMLLQFPAGFVTPLHLHSSESRGVVLQGTARRGPHAGAMTDLPVGSSWVQTADEPHADGCSDAGPCIAWLEMDGPLHVAPVDSPLEGATGGIVTLAADQPWSPANPAEPDGPERVVLAGDASSGPVRALMRFPVGYDSGIHTHPGDYDAAVVTGLALHGPAVDGLIELPPGSWWAQPAAQPHVHVCGQPDGACTLIIAMDGPLEMRASGR